MELIESIIFGHKKGAFTGAVRTHIGKFELAHGGTLFLDEVADMPNTMQAKMLRAIEEGKIERVGGERSISVDVRIVAASNKNLLELVRQNLFRQDLFFRLNVFRIVIPPLRERKADIADLVHLFVDEFTPLFEKRVSSVSGAYIQCLLDYDWPGNVRELRNAVQYSMARLGGRTLMPGHLEGFFPAAQEAHPLMASQIGTSLDLSEFEEKVILDALKRHQGNKTEAAKALGIGRSTLYRKLKAMEL
jgi:transcriptional regulator with PAS, ATPase and Fis domain